MYDKIKKHKTEIIISSLIGVLLFYIQPLLGYLGDKFINGLLFISDTFAMDYYSRLAYNDVNAFDELTNMLLVLMFSLFMIAFIIYSHNIKVKLKDKSSSMLSEIITMKKKLVATEVEPVNKEELLISIEEAEKQAISIHAKLNKRDNLSISIKILTFFTILLLFYTYVTTSSIKNENITFRNNLIIIEPYTSPKEIQMFKSSWVRSKNKNDFQLINYQIELIKEKNGIK